MAFLVDRNNRHPANKKGYFFVKNHIEKIGNTKIEQKIQI